MVFRQQQEEAVRAQALLAEKERQAAAAAAVDLNAMDIDSQAVVDDAAANVAAEEQEEATLGSKVIVIHPGSQNLRIGLANDALPKSLPNVIARRADKAEYEEEERSPKRMKVVDDDGDEVESDDAMFGEEVCAGCLRTKGRDSVADGSSLKRSLIRCRMSLKSACDIINGVFYQTLEISSFRTIVVLLRR